MTVSTSAAARSDENWAKLAAGAPGWTPLDGKFTFDHADLSVFKGSTPGRDGRTVILDVTMTKARLEDVLKLAVKTPTSPMTGAVQMKTRFVLGFSAHVPGLNPTGFSRSAFS